jgi:hypothetical protein
MYQLKNVKPFDSPEGGGFNATLYRDGKRVGSVHDGGYGGCYQYNWFTNEAEADFYKSLETTLVDETVFKDDGFIETGKKKPATEVWGNSADDGVVGQMVDDFLNRKEFKSKIKRRILYIKDGDIYILSSKIKPVELAELRPLLLERYGADTIILNDLPFEEGYSLWLEKAQ